MELERDLRLALSVLESKFERPCMLKTLSCGKACARTDASFEQGNGVPHMQLCSIVYAHYALRGVLHYSCDRV